MLKKHTANGIIWKGSGWKSSIVYSIDLNDYLIARYEYSSEYFAVNMHNQRLNALNATI